MIEIEKEELDALSEVAKNAEFFEGLATHAYARILAIGESAQTGIPSWEIVRELAKVADFIEKSFPEIKIGKRLSATTLWCVSDSLRAEEHEDTLAKPVEQE